MTRPTRKVVVKKKADAQEPVQAQQAPEQAKPEPVKQRAAITSPAPSAIVTADEMKARLSARGPETLEDRIADSRKVLNFPLPPDQKFFETYDGEIIVGDADKEQIWCDRLNRGKGAWVLPRR